MKITRLESCQAVPIDMEGVEGVTKQVPIGRGDGAPNFAIRVFTLRPGGHTPHHGHESEHLNYVLDGSGEIMDGNEPRAISKGDFILVKPHEKHQYRNTGSGPLVFLCMVPIDYE